MLEIIFSSWFKLNFFRNDIEIDYQKQKEQKIYQYNNYMIIFTFILSVIDTSIYSFFFEYHLSTTKFIQFSSYVITGMFIIFIIISFFCKNNKVLKWLHYINYYLLSFLFLNFRYLFVRMLKLSSIFFDFFLLVEMVIRIVWIILGLQSFLECFVLNILSIISAWIFYLPMYQKEVMYSAVLNILVYSFALITVIVFAYFMERQLKNAYYFHMLSDKKAIWLTNVLETMNAGFLSIKRNKVDYINSFLKNQIKKIKKCENIENYENKNSSEINLIIQNNNADSDEVATNSNSLIKWILSNINTDSINEAFVQKLISEFKAEIKSQISEEDYVKTFIKYISQIPDINTFKPIGDKVVELEDSELSFEIQCRYTKSETEGYELDLLLNDVSRTKLKEKQMAEFKYKTVFLSKIAHEFKNPLICISELTDQINDEIEKQSLQHKFSDSCFLNIFEQIKSLSNFLLILVKDLNCFSESQIGNKTLIEKKETNLKEVVNFCKSITELLMQKNNKSQVLEFLTIINDNVPSTIMTDNWRLKQVLINLLSNSVKFTLYGLITLEISMEKINDKEMIKFLVKDTGVGMKEEQKKKLFIPFSKEFNEYNNEMGSGLGLGIANEIVKKLGGEKINFHSEYESGSSFWFYVNNSQHKKKTMHTGLSKESAKKENEIINDEQEQVEIIPSDSHSISSIQTEQKELEPFKVKQLSESLIRERKVHFDDSSSSNRSEKSPSINFKNQPTEVKNTSDAVAASTKEDASNKLTLIDFITKNLSTLRKQSNFLNVMVVDDEPMTRRSIIRILNNVSNELNIKINIIEAEDGVESIFLVYKASTQGIKISLIFSDETMHYINGSRSSEIINEILHKKNINEIPFYLVTAFEENLIKKFVNPSIKMIISKPLSKEIAKKLIAEKAGLFDINNLLLI